MSQDKDLGIGGVERLPNVYEKHGTQDFVEWYKEQAEFVGANVVDIGCGAGHPFTSFMAELSTYVGVEKEKHVPIVVCIRRIVEYGHHPLT